MKILWLSLLGIGFLISAGQAFAQVDSFDLKLNGESEAAHVLSYRESGPFRADLIQSSLDNAASVAINAGVSLPVVRIYTYGNEDQEKTRKISLLAQQRGFEIEIVDLQQLGQAVQSLSEHDDPLAENRQKLENSGAPIQDPKVNASILRSFKQWWAKKYVPLHGEARREAVTVASTMLSYKLYLGGFIWFSVGVNPYLAGLLAIGQAAADYYLTLHSGTLNNILGGAEIQNPEKRYSRLREVLNRIAYSAVFTVFWRDVSTLYGSYGAVHLLSTLQGKFEVAWNVLVKGLPGSIFATAGNREYDQTTYRRVSVVAFSISTALSTIDLAGLSFHSWLLKLNLPYMEPVLLQIKDTSILQLGFWALTIMLVKIAPKKVSHFIDTAIAKTARVQERGQKLLLGIFKSSSPKSAAVSCSSLWSH